MNLFWRGSSALCLISLCTLFACKPAPQPQAPPPPKVTVAHPQQRKLTDYEEYNGWTAPVQTVEIRSRVRGHIMKVNFTDGQQVSAGQSLFELDPQPFQAEIGRAEGQLQIARSNLELAVKEEARQKTLFDKGATTVQEYERAVANRQTWDSQIDTAVEEVKRRQLDLTYAQITSPIAGKIGRALLTTGNLVNAGGGDTLLTTVVALNPIKVYFNVDERSLTRYRQRRSAGQTEPVKPVEEAKIPFEFALESDLGFPHSGELDFADNRIDASTGTIEVRGSTPNTDGRFIPGGRVRVRVAISEPYEALLVPDVAVLTDQNRKYLLTLNDKNVVIRRDVQLGQLLDDGMRVVLPEATNGGLAVSDRVIVLGLQRARVNYPVEPMDADGKSVAKE